MLRSITKRIYRFCENGSLHSICKRFGKFPEPLVAVYISQVLEGLVYLHDQGVIHRDIKGANILTNKDGCVKLADFGVASSTAVGAVRDDAVVGSPYWSKFPSPDSDNVLNRPNSLRSGSRSDRTIRCDNGFRYLVCSHTGPNHNEFAFGSQLFPRSVGCTVIELLEGKPPYHFLDPMPALFRIVQDDNPPIPEGASPIVKDFLYHCFQKDCNLRVSAKKLLKHPWMQAARKQMVAHGQTNLGTETSRGENGRPLSNYNYDEAVLKVQEWNEALKCK